MIRIEPSVSVRQRLESWLGLWMAAGGMCGSVKLGLNLEGGRSFLDLRNVNSCSSLLGVLAASAPSTEVWECTAAQDVGLLLN